VEHGEAAFALDGEDEEDEADNEVKPSDSVLVVALTEDDHSHLEVQLLAEDGTMFTHHDISLPDFPLCLAWLDCPPFRNDPNTAGQEVVGNYIAVGSFQPAIEIWNLDVLDPLEPSAVLGGLDPGAAKPKMKSGKKATKETYLAGSHTDAVMGLSWNRNFRQAIASASADKTVKIWDVTTQQCSHTFTHHTDKVTWHFC
jgi:periodic tryptophan protein 1